MIYVHCARLRVWSYNNRDILSKPSSILLSIITMLHERARACACASARASERACAGPLLLSLSPRSRVACARRTCASRPLSLAPSSLPSHPPSVQQGTEACSRHARRSCLGAVPLSACKTTPGVVLNLRSRDAVRQSRVKGREKGARDVLGSPRARPRASCART